MALLYVHVVVIGLQDVSMVLDERKVSTLVDPSHLPYNHALESLVPSGELRGYAMRGLVASTRNSQHDNLGAECRESV